MRLGNLLFQSMFMLSQREQFYVDVTAIVQLSSVFTLINLWDAINYYDYRVVMPVAVMSGLVFIRACSASVTHFQYKDVDNRMQVGVYTQPHLVAATSIHCSSRADSILCPLSSVFYTSRPSTIGFSTKVVHRLVRFPIAYLRSTCQELKQQTLFGKKLFHFQVFIFKKLF